MNQHHFVDHVYLGCTKRERKLNETVCDEYTKMFESRISAEATEKLSGWEKPHAKTVASPYEMCEQYTNHAHVFLMLSLSACLSQPVVTVVQVDILLNTRITGISPTFRILLT